MVEVLWIFALGIGVAVGVILGELAALNMREGNIPVTGIILSALGFTLAAWSGAHIHG